MKDLRELQIHPAATIHSQSAGARRDYDLHGPDLSEHKLKPGPARTLTRTHRAKGSPQRADRLHQPGFVVVIVVVIGGFQSHRNDTHRVDEYLQFQAWLEFFRTEVRKDHR
jgi:hypothetical protein